MFDNLTKDQRESVVLIAILLFFAIITITGGFLLSAQYFIFSFLLILCGLFLAGIAVTGYVVEFVEKKDKDE